MTFTRPLSHHGHPARIAGVIAIDERSDEQLLQATGSNPEAYAAFYRRHVRAVLAYTLSRTGRPDAPTFRGIEVAALRPFAPEANRGSSGLATVCAQSRAAHSVI